MEYLEECLRNDLNLKAPRAMAVLKPLKIISLISMRPLSTTLMLLIIPVILAWELEKSLLPENST